MKAEIVGAAAPEGSSRRTTERGDQARPRPFESVGFWPRVAPFAAVMAIGAASALIKPYPSRHVVISAAVVVVVMVAMIAALRAEWLGRALDPLPPLLVLVLVGLLREGQGGAISGYAVLYLLPVLWFALYGTRVHVIVAVAGVSVSLLAPLVVIGGANYPASEWRRAVIMTGLGALLGWATFTVVEAQRRQSAEMLLVQTTSTRLTGLLDPDDIVAEALAAITNLDAGATGETRTVLFRIIGPDVTVAATDPSSGVRVEHSSFALEAHPYLPGVVSTREPCHGPLRRDQIAATVGGGSASDGVVQGCYVPLVVDGSLYGVVGATTDRRALTTDRFERIVTIANMASISLANALAHRQLLVENSTLHKESETDPLTGLANRRAWDQRLDALDQRLIEEELEVHVGVIDLDHFKAFNDTKGHAAGDRLLQLVATNWSAVLRRGDLLARIGGEEFGFVSVGVPIDTTLELAERLRSATGSTATCSIGVACHEAGERLADTVNRADIALYEAKSQGRNRVRIDPGPGTGSEPERTGVEHCVRVDD